jgi:hypothetical protein
MLKEKINGADGFTTELSLSAEELKILREEIESQWIYRLQIACPEHVKKFRELGLENYHKLSHLVDHAKIWPKTARVLPEKAFDRLKDMRFYTTIRKEFGEFVLSDEEGFGWGVQTWRLVRPGKEDIGPIHSDKWFWDLGHGNMPSYPCERVKIWIAICTSPGKNGLCVIPGSHKKTDWKWHAETKSGLSKPVFDEDLTKLDIRVVDTKPGNAVVFHDLLLHGGVPNAADQCRVSMEVTVICKK